MPRKGRIDVEGAVHHITQRGIEKGRIFWDDADYRSFLKRLTLNLEEAKTTCYAWSLMPNHVHLVLKTGNKPISHVLQCVFTGHAVFINKKYNRSGHLFQGRYKSLLCEEEAYLLRLVRYVHLNPVVSGIVNSVDSLADYRWTGHRCLMGIVEIPWQKASSVLHRFGNRIGQARRNYVEYMEDGLGNTEDETDLLGQGLKRLSEGGWESDHDRNAPSDAYADERIIGSREFVAKVLKHAGERERWRSKMAGSWTSEQVMERAAKETGIKVSEMKGSGKRPAQCKARSMACKWLVDDLGRTETEVASLLGITQPGVSDCVKKGRILEANGGSRLGSYIAI